jgi:hypothetical protein
MHHQAHQARLEMPVQLDQLGQSAQPEAGSLARQEQQDLLDQ